MKNLKETYLSFKSAMSSVSRLVLKLYTTVGMITFYLFSGTSFATPGAGQIASQMMTEVSQIGRLIVASSYMLSFGVGVWGAFKLREASKQQGQTSYKEALVILVVAGLLAVITTVVGAMSGSIFTSGQDAAPGISQPSFSG